MGDRDRFYSTFLAYEKKQSGIVYVKLRRNIRQATRATGKVEVGNGVSRLGIRAGYKSRKGKRPYDGKYTSCGAWDRFMGGK